jgi:type II secretory pathway pseudopilin PulG
LLELLVVLTLVALTMGMVLPIGARWVDAVRERGWRGDLYAALAALPLRSFNLGQAQTLDARALRALVADAPGDLEIKLAAPLRYSATGIAEGGKVQLRVSANAQFETWTVEPITGRVLP